jgi:hypothetical protein
LLPFANAFLDLIREYIREANAQRKFDDAKTLKISLEEIQQEIARLAAMS